MRTLFGMILGCFLTIGFVYIHDSNAVSASSAVADRQIVNWDVASSKWSQVRANANEAWIKIKAGIG